MTRKNKARLIAAATLLTAPVWLIPAVVIGAFVSGWRSAVSSADRALESKGIK